MSCRKQEDTKIEKDISEKILEDYDDVFADIVNVLLFEGKQLIRPEELIETAVHSQYKSDDGKLHEQERDIAKYWKKNGTRIAMCGIENQTKTDRLMPLRIMGYDGASYRSQILEEKPTAIPVVTIVLHFGEEHWTSPRTLKSGMNVPPELEPYVNDYSLHVYEIAWLTEKQIEKFTSDFKVVARFFVNKRKRNTEKFMDDTEIQHVDEVLKLLSVMTRDDRYEQVRIKAKGKVRNMCEVVQYFIDQGLEKGKLEGKLEGRLEGKLEGENMLADLMKKLFQLGRIEDAKAASENIQDRQKLYREFGIIE